MILYINGNYPYHSLHSELVAKLADKGNDITVYIPINGIEAEGKYRCDHPRVRVVYSNCLGKLDKIFFIHKVRKIARKIEKDIDMNKVDSILAGTIYSDGLAAWLLHRKYHIPYAVAVRQTDITYHMKWRPYLNVLIEKLLKNASKIIFLAPAFQKHLDKFGCDQNKYIVIPNAINDYWFQNHIEARSIHDPLSLIYVGEITKNKNVKTTITAIAKLNQKGIRAEFHVIGAGEEEEACRSLAKQLNVEDKVFFHGWQNSREKLKGFYDQADIFVMPSFRESFGTVYVEALSQGLPIIYTRGQGIDGYYDQGTVGYSCDPEDVNEIVAAIIAIKDNYLSISAACCAGAQRFQWKVVAEEYNCVINDMRNR